MIRRLRKAIAGGKFGVATSVLETYQPAGRHPGGLSICGHASRCLDIALDTGRPGCKPLGDFFVSPSARVRPELAAGRKAFLINPISERDPIAHYAASLQVGEAKELHGGSPV